MFEKKILEKNKKQNVIVAWKVLSIIYKMY